jgi:soluble lytic murein transglycosylase-like protein
MLAACCLAPAGHAQSTHTYDALIATHAAANGVPEALVRRIILRESRYRPGLVGRGGTLGLMQIKLATARGLGYTGTADGLLDPNTNLTYAVKYLAGAYRTAGGNADRAVGYYAGGYYYAAKHQQLAARAAKANPQGQDGNGEPPAKAPIAVRSTRTTPAAERVGAR